MKKFQIVGAIVVLLLLIIGVGKKWNKPTILKTGSSSNAPVILRIGYSAPSMNHSPTMVAIEKNMFVKYGLTTKTIPLKNGNDVQQALAANQIDVGIAGATIFFNPISNGVPIKIIMPLVASPTTIQVRKNSGLTALTQLKNIKIGVEPSVSSDTLVVLQVLQQENIDTKSLNFVPIEKTLRPIALLQKKEIDASIANGSDRNNYDSTLAMELKGWTDSVYPKQSYLRNVVAVNTNFLQKYPDVVLNYVKTMIEAQKFIMDNPLESAQLVSSHMQRVANASSMTKEKATKGFKEITFMVWDDPQVLQKIADTSFAVGELKTKLTLDQFFDTRFAPILEKAQQEIYGPTTQK